MNKEGYERIASDDDCDYEYEIENEFSQRVSSWANHESEPLLHEPEASKDWIFDIKKLKNVTANFIKILWQLKFLPATCILVASMTGIGVLAFPHAFVEAGGSLNSILLQFWFKILNLHIKNYNLIQHDYITTVNWNFNLEKVTVSYYVLDNDERDRFGYKKI